MNNDTLRTSLIAGAIGLVLGAASMQAATQILEASANRDRPSVRDLNQEALDNFEERGDRADVIRATKAMP